ncbi:DUF600 family protein [Vibrio alginolyticus]|uniref:immunity protein YezG family protein n=1 Tax=Vibrio alginolyticus TaxID=663 RepID=UPI001BD2D7A0|nr:immunity protein YezG family protein [Vibrio alginolyticus]MBS9995492.1 DUF600 family protein [Vibrio alginolyticus]
MFSTAEEIYNHVGGAILEVAPEQWCVAWVDIAMNLSTRAVYFHDRYLVDANSDDVKDLDIYSSDNIELDDAFSDLFDFMSSKEQSKPWNKARFIVYPDGDFEIEFKWDEDWAWLSSLDPDKDIYPDGDTARTIRSWDGLGENAYRPWFDPDSAMFKKD